MSREQENAEVCQSRCPEDSCRCCEWPPVKCPQCGTVILGATPEDWYRHFEEECESLGVLYCFVSKPTETTL